jgi:hypothetical protein
MVAEIVADSVYVKIRFFYFQGVAINICSKPKWILAYLKAESVYLTTKNEQKSTMEKHA